LISVKLRLPCGKLCSKFPLKPAGERRRPILSNGRDVHFLAAMAFAFAGYTVAGPSDAGSIRNRADVRMVQRRRGARLALKAFQSLRVQGKASRQELERYKAAELGVLGLVDHTHPTATQLLQCRNGRQFD
jgi:hypothetical protein